MMLKLLLLFLLFFLLHTQKQADKKVYDKVNNQKTYKLSGNNLKATFKNNGQLIQYDENSNGLTFPAAPFSNNYNNGEEQAGTIFTSGLWIGGKINSSVRTSTAVYGSHYTPGKITYVNEDLDANFTKEKYAEVYYHFSDKYIEFINTILNEEDSSFSKKKHSFAKEQLELIKSSPDWSIAVELGAPKIPPGDISAFMLYHDADTAKNTVYEKRKPLNIQIQQLNWLYITEKGTAIDNSYFTQIELINKNPVDIDSIYIGIFVDSDIGEFDNDYIGSDYELKLGYSYNAYSYDKKYHNIGLAPPAVGINFLQGPIIDDDQSSIYTIGKNFPVYINKKFYHVPNALKNFPNKRVLAIEYFTTWFGTGGSDGSPFSSSDHYNYLKGKDFYGHTLPSTKRAIKNGLTTPLKSRYMFNGDPLSKQGWIETITPSDRKFLISSGPFNLKPYKDTNNNGKADFGDEGYNSIVYTTINSISKNNLLSVDKLKKDLRKIQGFFKNGLVREADIPKPLLKTIADKNSFILNWKESVDRYTNANALTEEISTETYHVNGKKFQGYQLVQFYDESLKEFKEITCIDIHDNIDIFSYETLDNGVLNRHFLNGQNSGIKNSIRIYRDHIENRPLLEKKNYFYGIRAYAISGSDISFSDWEYSDRIRLDPSRIIKNYSQKLSYEVENGFTDYIDVRIVNPVDLKDSKYEIRFTKLNEDKYHYGYLYNGNIIPKGTIVWSLYENQELIVSDFPQSQFKQSSYSDFYHNGLRFRVKQVPPDLYSIKTIANADGKLKPPVAAALKSAGFPTNDESTFAMQQSNQQKWLIHAGGAIDSSYSSFKARSFRYGIHRTCEYDFEVRFTKRASKAGDITSLNQTELIDLPFELWNSSLNVRMIPYIHDEDNNGKFNLQKKDHPASPGNDDPYTDWLYWYFPKDLSPGESGYEAWLSANGNRAYLGEEAMARTVFVAWNAGLNTNNQFPENGTIFKFITNKSHHENLIVKINPISGKETILSSNPVLMQNYPNPFNPVTNIQFSLPENQFISLKIYNVLGQEVWKKEGFFHQGQNQILWNSKNSHGMDLASGIYFYRLFSKNNVQSKKMILIR